MKPPVSQQDRDRVLELRRSHSISDVARQTGLPLGTVKTICARSGAFRDNAALRALFSLPPIQASSSTALEVVSLPPQTAVTGDPEVDAVLWLREVLKTGNAGHIAKALEAAKRIKTPLKELEHRYVKHLCSTNPGNTMAALFSSFGFADLDDLAKSSAAKAAIRHEGIARFGSEAALFADTPAERFCIEALKGLRRKEKFGLRDYAASEVDERFNAHADLRPQTLADCLHELAYWDALQDLRNAYGTAAGDPSPQADARDEFAFRSLARIRPRSKAEAIQVFRYMADGEKMDRAESEAILLNLIG